MNITTQQAQGQQPEGRRVGIARAAKKLGKWIVQEAASGAAREVLRYALGLWEQM
ncbi:hypothetical protein [Streptomyces phaeochromogenes]|uniref:hypothetical protein n=1 Tax=Streptomyces phaeochromogenes TaxID=1923 RepID=UPI00386E61BC|nr:hypothetical protein OHB08_01745 [Streptomyces phaeochromogenes]